MLKARLQARKKRINGGVAELVMREKEWSYVGVAELRAIQTCGAD
jgi:hypothetical protein